MLTFGRNCVRRIVSSTINSTFSSLSLNNSQKRDKNFPDNFDLNQLKNENFLSLLRQNLANRGSDLNLDHLLDLYQKYKSGNHELKSQLLSLINQIPNTTYPLTPIGDSSKAQQLYIHGNKRNDGFPMKNVLQLTAPVKSNAYTDASNPDSPIRIFPRGHLRTKHLTESSGQRTYYCSGPVAQLESALIEFTLDRLKQSGFALVSVPDIIDESLINACGFPTNGVRSQIYHISPPINNSTYCLSGTSEMGLAGFCSDQCFKTDLDESKDAISALGLCAVSRCFRQEVSQQESILYRVHQFTKVEMFAVTPPVLDLSDAMFNQLIKFQIKLFADLELHFRVLEMPSKELGDSAYRKVDIEAWMPGEEIYGEVSSTSNCLDFQSKRLNIRWSIDDKDESLCSHTLNGTACAIPRILKSLIETHQTEDGHVILPKALRPYMEKEIKNYNSYPSIRFQQLFSTIN